MKLYLPNNVTGLRLCKINKADELTLCEPVMFKRGRVGVDTVLRRAAVCGSVGPIGETGDFWADMLTEDGDWNDTIALDRAAWNSLKNHWMRCRVQHF